MNQCSKQIRKSNCKESQSMLKFQNPKVDCQKKKKKRMNMWYLIIRKCTIWCTAWITPSSLWEVIPALCPRYVALWTVCPAMIQTETNGIIFSVNTSWRSALTGETKSEQEKQNAVYQKMGRTSSLVRKTFAGGLQGKERVILDSSIRPRFCSFSTIVRFSSVCKWCVLNEEKQKKLRRKWGTTINIPIADLSTLSV